MTRLTRRPSRSLVLVAVAVVLALGALGAAAVATDALGAGYAFGRVVARVSLFLDPPPDREIPATVEVTPRPSLAVTPSASPSPAGPTPSAGTSVPPSPPASPSPSPSPLREPVDVQLPLDPKTVFAHQLTKEWCAVAGTQIVLAALGLADNGDAFQRTLDGRIDEWESRRDSRDGGWGPAAIAQALAAYGATGYEVRAYQDRDDVMRDAAAALSTTHSPVVLIAWYGAHTWVMTGYRADADPTIFPDAHVTGAYIYDPWYPWVSTLWGPSDPPGTFQDEAEMERNYKRWIRPEGKYPDRDYKFIAVVPTVVVTPPS